MKKSKFISLVLITATLAACQKKQEDEDWGGTKKAYLRSDSTASYTRHHGGNAWLWFYAFRPYGIFSNGSYRRAGYYSGGISHSSNIGSNSYKGRASRGGFGRSGFSSSRS
jgi:hypothetical protein